MNTPASNQSARINKSACRTNPFAMVAKTVLDDPTISFTAKGIMAYLIGKPDNWKLRVTDLVNHNTLGERAVRTAINELREAGYAEYIRPKQVGAEGEWKICDIPNVSRHCCFSNGGGRNGVNSPLSKNDSTNNDSSKNDGLKEDAALPRCPSRKEKKPLWKPSTASKSEQLAALRVPRNFPSQAEFESWTLDNCANIDNYRPDLYLHLCNCKWHEWCERFNRWVKIGDWKAYVMALDDHIDLAKNR